MMAFVVRGRHLTQRARPLPKLRPGWALVRVRLAGICNTDLEILRGYHRFRGTPGHEFVGEVEEVRGAASAVRARWVGRRVVGEINIGCRALGHPRVCRYCRRGLRSHCDRRKVLGIVDHDGAFAEYLALPVENLHAVPASVSDEAAVFTEPLAAACQIAAQVDLPRFRSAAVLGDGKLGQLIARVLRLAGPRVVLFGKHGAKLAIARAAGIATARVTRKARALNELRNSFPLVVEATGSPAGLAFAQEIVAPRGTLVLKSTFHGAAPVETWPLVVKEIQAVGSRCGPFKKALALLHSRRVDPLPLISRSFALAEAPAAAVFAEKPGVLKVLLRP